MALFFVDTIRQDMYCVLSPDVQGFSLPLNKARTRFKLSVG